MRRIRLLLGLAACVLTVAACTGAPDREEEADGIKASITAMPGVSDVSMRYSNDVLGGTIFDLTVDMDDATDQQIGDVATRLHELRGDDFADYDQLLAISAGHWLTLRIPKEFDPARVEQAAGLSRALRSQVEAGVIEWSVGTDAWAVDITDAADPGRTLDTVLRVLAGRPAAVDVDAPGGEPGPHWRVDAGFTAADKHRIDSQLASVPVQPGWIQVEDGQLTRLTFGIANPATAYQDVVAVIRAVDAGPQHPLGIVWSWDADPARSGEPRWAGSASVGRCDGGATPIGQLVPEAAALQQRIRDEFEKCS